MVILEIDLVIFEWIDILDGCYIVCFLISVVGVVSLCVVICLEICSGLLFDDVLLYFVGVGKEIFEVSGKDFLVNCFYWSLVIEGDILIVELVLLVNL